jgi:hypothetical protein
MRRPAKTIDTGSVERIMAKLGEVPQIDQRVLQHIDRDLLLRELRRCAVKHSVRSGFGGFRLTEQNLKKLKRLKILLNTLRNDQKTPWRVLGKETTNALKSDKIIDELDAVLACSATPRLQANPTELLVNQDLPFISKGFFGLEAKRSRGTDGKLYGPYLAFVDAVLKEMGIRYSRASTSRALSDRGGRRAR